MKPVAVTTTVERPIAEVYAYLDVLANHEAFTDHFIVDWKLDGPPRGVGAILRAKVKAPGRTEVIELTVLEAQAPTRSVEETVGAGGKRRTRGTYELTALSDTRTEVRFTIEPIAVPASERPLWPLSRVWLRRQNARAMERLRALLEATPARAAA